MLLALVSCLFLVSTSFAQHCNDPKISDIKTYSTSNPNLHDETSYVIEFRAQCAGNTKNVMFYTEINGKHLSSSCDESGEKYQITWSEPIQVAQSGYVNVKLYTEESFLALKKAQRNQADTNSVKEVKTISFYHSQTSKGPVIQFELVAVIIAGVVLILASSTKNQLLA